MMLVRPLASAAPWLLMVLCLTAASLSGAPRSPNGADLYRQLCVECHGKTGGGVKGKYDDALHGDWSVEKLTRYIDKNMPEDAPGKCVGADAAAVARYIHDTFYSREAWARLHPARVELVRLTNRQYVNTVADLLKSFGAADAAFGSERGLRGNYRPKPPKSGPDLKPFDRLDRQIDFRFDAGSPDAGKLGTGTNEFSISWRGALLAEETGDYEFLLKTPNGVQLWVNDEAEPLIDARVASDMNELKGVIRLIGGRAYPLRIEHFKAPKDKSASLVLRWRPPHGVTQIIPARNLLPARVAPTFVLTTPFPPDDSSVGYERGVAVSKAWDEATTQAAIETAGQIVKQLDRLSNSKPKDTNRAARVEAFCHEFVAAALRRPLTAEQKRVFVGAQFQKTPKAEEAVKRVVLLTMKSPRFLYLGLATGPPDDHEIATRLAFALWDSLPDRELTKLAAQGALRTREQVEAQARRLLGDARARAKMRAFFHHWLRLDHVESLAKDEKLFPGFTPEIAGDLRTSLDLFLDDVVWSGGSDYRRLLLAEDFFVNGRLAEFYGVKADVTDDFVKASLPPGERSGLLTHPYLLAAFSYSKSTSPIHRGVFLTRSIVGRALKPPPMAVAFKDADFAPNLTMREKIVELTRPKNCQGCHAVINPLGFSLEKFDAVGKFRTHENGRPVSAGSEYVTDDGATLKLTGAREVAQFALGSTHAQDAFIEQMFHQVVKQPLLAYGTDVPGRLRQSFTASGFNIQKLLVDIATIAALRGTEKKR